MRGELRQDWDNYGWVREDRVSHTSVGKDEVIHGKVGMDGVEGVRWEGMGSYSIFTSETKEQCRGGCDIQSWVND